MKIDSFQSGLISLSYSFDSQLIIQDKIIELRY